MHSQSKAIKPRIKKPAQVVDRRDYDLDFRISRDKLFKRFDGRTQVVYEGRNRRVYVLGRYVVKIPLNWDGVADNDWEGSVRNGVGPPSKYDVIYPKTRLVYVDDIPVLLMEIVRHASAKLIRRVVGSMPKWVDRVDCGQVGFTKHLRLVAYDYGIR